MPYIEIDHTSRPVGPGVLTIGAGTEASWRIVGHGLSPLHAIIAPEDHGRVSIVQGAPDARILVNGVELEGGAHTLAIGDRLQLNDVLATFREVPREVEGSKDAYLRDARRGRLYRVTDQSQIGRDLRCTVLIQEPDVSRTHAEIVREGKNFLLKPSGGVTLLNGERVVAPTPLHEGDELMVGRTHLRFSREVPRNAIVGGSSQANSRAAKMRTTFMGAVAMHDMEQKTARRKLGRVLAIVAAAVLIVAGLLAVWGAAPQSAQATSAREGRRSARHAAPFAAPSALPRPSPEASAPFATPPALAVPSDAAPLAGAVALPSDAAGTRAP